MLLLDGKIVGRRKSVEIKREGKREDMWGPREA
jgi:hypothetical protein